MMRVTNFLISKIHVWLMLLVVSVAFCSAAMAQSAGGTRWIMSYEDADRTFKLSGEVLQKDGVTELKWTSREPANSDESIEQLPSVVPNWQFPQTKNASGSEIVFEHDELAATIQNGKGVLFINGQAVDQATYASKIQLNESGGSDEISQRVSISHFIQMLGGAVATQESPMRLGMDITQGSHIRSRHHGLRLHLFNPQAKGRSILWDWEAQHGFDENFGSVKKFQGSVEGNNPIIWGPSARIAHIFVASAQRELAGEPEAPIYPEISGLSVERTEPGASKPNERELIILGHELDTIEAEEVFGNNPGISYSNFQIYDAVHLRDRLSKLAPEAVNDDVLAAVEDTRWQDDLQAYFVTATISSPIQAGLIDLFIDDLSGQWPLLYGDLNGLITIVRPEISELLRASDVGSDLRAPEQPSRPLYFRDEIVFQAVLDKKLESETISIKFTDNPVVLASQQDDSSALEITLTRVADSPRTYRSQSYVLANKETYLDAESAKEKTTIVQRDDGSKQTFTLPGQDIFEDLPADRTLLVANETYLRPRFIEGENIDQLEPLGDAQVRNAEDTVAGDFIAALKVAAECRDRYVGTNWDKLSVEEQQSISIGIAWSHRVPVSFGHHAAALMVRAKFLESLNQHASAIGSLANADAANVDFVRAVTSLWTGEPSPISLLAASSRSGLFETLNLRHSGGTTLLVDGGAVNPEIAADVRTFLKQQEVAMRGAASVASTPDDCDVVALLKITGKGFEPIIQVLKSEVSRIQTNGDTGVAVRRPDMVARRALDTLAEKLSEYDTVSAFNDRQKDVINALISTAGLVSGVGAAYYGGSVLAGIALAADSTDFVLTCADNACGSIEDYSNLKLARGATSVLGESYLTEAEKQATAPLTRLANVGLSGFVAGSSANGLRQALKSTTAFTGGKAVLDSLTSSDVVGTVKDATSVITELKNAVEGE